MTLDDLKDAVAQLSPAQRQQLHAYLAPANETVELQAGTLDMGELTAALADIRAGLSDAEFAEIEAAMNAEHIEPLDDNA
jgi:hypothetical protein